jgi:benzoyl-CoA reductase/2-hydroxyglutaryl-CoA dehydratase subunit BcrC/BadD/HgdB
VRYLFSPYEYSCRGDTLLRRLKFDDSTAALRLWAFLFSEKDRLFLARENGVRIVAAMKDLGQVPVITYAFPRTLTFYADELWWAPCFSEEPHLLEEAARLGAGEELCYVRAALGAMVTLDYFPRPDLCIAGVGACCDDFSAVMQLIEARGLPVHWWEMAARLDRREWAPGEVFSVTPHGGALHQESAVGFLEGQMRGVAAAMARMTGYEASGADLERSRDLFNGLRGRVRELRELAYGARRPPLPGLEMLLAEFVAIHTCSEPEESIAVLDDLLATARARVEEGSSPLGGDPLRVYWVTPPTDASLVTLLEDLGGCIAGSDYMIGHAYLPLATDKGVFRAVAENCMDDAMVGSPAARAARIASEARRFGAEGVIISGIFGASHCAHEEKATAAILEREGLPVLAFDVPWSPGRLSGQVSGRMEGFVEMLRSNRSATVRPGCAPAGRDASGADPFAYFRDSMSVEVDAVRDIRRRGGGIVGIYCEYTPRDVIMAAGAHPVCLCGANRRTIPPAETVLPSNLCPLIKSSFGYVLTNRCPFFTVCDAVVAETTCDGKKKMYELIAGRRPQHILELTQKADEPEAFAHWLAEVRKLGRFLEDLYGRPVTDGALASAIRAMNRERALLRSVFELGAQDPPVATGSELALVRYRLSGWEPHLEMLERFLEAVRGRAEGGATAGATGAPRVMVTGCPTARETLKVIELIEESGGIVVVQESCSGIKPLAPVAEDGDPWEAVARKHFEIPCSCMTPNRGRLELVADLARRFRPAAVVDLVWHACHTYNIESWLLERFVRDELGLKFMKVETDYSDSDRERLAVRLQTLLEMT